MAKESEKREDKRLDRLLSETDEILGELTDLDHIAQDYSSNADQPAQERARRKFAERGEYDYLPFDGYAEFTVSADEMEVTGDFFPPGEGMAPLDIEKIKEQLRAKNVVHGVDWETLQEAVFSCNTERVAARDVVVAQGTKPRDEIGPQIVLEKETEASYDFAKDDADRVDYRSAAPFTMVKKGEVLARLQHKRPGEMGKSVTGRSIPYRSRKVKSLKPGANTERQGGTIVAAKEGRFDSDERSFWVSEVLEVAEDVDYKTGHIDFSGDVVIHGEVKDGFKVNAGGSVFCATTMDASVVTAAGDLIVKRGLIGRKSGTVRVGGNVTVKFIENCYVEAGGTVSVDAGIIHSAVYAGDRVQVGARGIIVGGEIHSQNGLSATQIGTESGAATEIYCGTDYEVAQKLEWVRDKTVALAGKYKEVESAIKRREDDTEQLKARAAKLQEAIRRMNESAQTLIFQLDKNDEATVRVRGAVMPGTYIEICHVSYAVDRKRTAVQFRLDKKSGAVKAEPLR